MNRHSNFFVYMIQDKNGTYYSGYTKDLANRIDLHEKGNGAKYLRGRAPLKLVYRKKYNYYKNALIAERRLKKLTRKRKQQLAHIFETNLSAGSLPMIRLSPQISPEKAKSAGTAECASGSGWHWPF